MNAARAACHEAGHAIIGLALGAVVKHVEVGNVGGWTEFSQWPADAASSALISAAGYAAEQVAGYAPLGGSVGGTDGKELRAILPASGIGSEAEVLRLARAAIRYRRAEWREWCRSLMAAYRINRAGLDELAAEFERELAAEASEARG